MNMKGALTALVIGASTLAVGAGLLGFHSLDNGERAVARDFFGNTRVIYKAGPFYNFLGDVEVYPDFMGLDFTAMPSHDGVKAEALPEDTKIVDYTYAPAVKYNEGGIGWVKGNVQFALPGDEDLMIALHKKYKTASNLQTTLMLRTTEEALQFTAGLMSSQEAYMTHRTQFRSYAKDQLDNGLYATKLEPVTKVNADGTEQVEMLPAIVNVNGVLSRSDVSPLDSYGISLTQFNIKDWDFEQKTKDQISLKRDAENQVITSKARTAKAEQDTLEAKAIADKNKAIAEGEANVLKAKAVIDAQRQKELATIAAQQQVEVAKQVKLQRGEELASAKLEAKSIEVLSIAEAEAADRKIKAGGQLSAEQQTRIKIAAEIAQGFAAAQRPQTVVLGGNGDNGELTGTSIDGFLQTMTAATATNLSVKAAK